MKMKKLLFTITLLITIIFWKNTYALNLGVSNKEDYDGTTYTDEEVEIISHGGAISPIVVEYGNLWQDGNLEKINVKLSLATGMNIISTKAIANEGTHSISGSNGDYTITFGNSSPDGEAIFEVKLPTPPKTGEVTLTATATAYDIHNDITDEKTIKVKYYVLVKNKSCDSSTEATVSASAGKPVKIGYFLGENYAFTTTEEKTDITVAPKSKKATVFYVVNEPIELSGGKIENIELSLGDNNSAFIIKSECSKEWEEIYQKIANANIVDTNLSDYSYDSSLVTMSITREEKKEEPKEKKSSINTLKNISISDAKITYKPDVNQYVLSVPYAKDSVTIKSSLTDSKSSYVEGYGNRTVKLNEGLNEIQLKVKAENGNINTYTLKITRDKNDDGSLKRLYVNDKELTLSKNTFQYTAYVENKITNVTIKAEANDKNAKVEIAELKELQVGPNKTKITITAANGKKTIYNITIVRDKVVSVNSKLKSLKIENYQLNFSGDVEGYTLHIDKKVRKLKITAIPENNNAKVEIIGNKRLKNGSVIKIKVTAQDKKTVSTYDIVIDKQNSHLPWLVLIILIIAGIAGVYYFYNEKKK